MSNFFPDYDNFYSFFTNVTKTKIRVILESTEWTIRKESWNDFEFVNEWSELHLASEESSPILSGVITDPETNFQKLIDVFKNFQVNFQAELYDKEQVIVRCYKNS